MRKILFILAIATQIFAYTIINGDTEILRADESVAKKIVVNGKEGKWIKHPNKNSVMIALISSNYRAKDDIKVEIFDSEPIVFKLKDGDYKKEQITVAPGMSSPSKENQERIKKESEEAWKIYSKVGDEFLFDSKFEAPLNSFITSNFGNARLFNGSLKSYHSGTDYRAAIGTPIKAANSGVVVLAKNRYFAGNSIIIDHGAGIYSQYYHLSRIDKKVGDKVKKGEIIGLSGDSGRVSGPHLHFGIMVGGNSVEPLKFIQKINYSLFEAE
ncbi:M23 family metallopeptidase [Campylobacter corcagiensis]|uniref:M23 family metallopeptidase n=1 Tax=Campylobacter corcagiensis TaxID=1448857 RepID=A0A7M1LHN3_9BACT|nr:M23 family metallopeptidase [Campylobacter corcagiensis]QKF64833.1 zinc metallopeptidase, M23 family [Campylobacter corcagiensis]QOQ87005.1 M23 family metallopeptidase [Campylobacter corcagiensis]